MTDHSDLSFIDAIEELSAVPTLAMDVMAMLNDPTINVKQIVQKIELDTGMAAFILKYCNSPLLGVRTEVNSISAAVNLIGFSRAKSILMSYFLRNLYNISGKKYITNSLWEHSVSVAFTARQMARHLNFRDEKREEAYLGGLLHDIGKLVIYYHIPKKYETLIQQAEKEKRSFLWVENEGLGYTHVEAGHRLVSKWEFPDLLKDSIRYHHIFSKYTGRAPIVGLVAFANSAVHFDFEKREDERPPQAYLKLFGLSEEKYRLLIDEIRDILEEAHLLQLD